MTHIRNEIDFCIVKAHFIHDVRLNVSLAIKQQAAATRSTTTATVDALTIKKYRNFRFTVDKWNWLVVANETIEVRESARVYCITPKSAILVARSMIHNLNVV